MRWGQRTVELLVWLVLHQILHSGRPGKVEQREEAVPRPRVVESEDAQTGILWIDAGTRNTKDYAFDIPERQKSREYAKRKKGV
jgi:hypothetical protein